MGMLLGEEATRVKNCSKYLPELEEDIPGFTYHKQYKYTTIHNDDYNRVHIELIARGFTLKFYDGCFEPYLVRLKNHD